MRRNLCYASARGAYALLALLVFALTLCAEKRWSGAAEYELANRISAEADPARRITLLGEWEATYPRTDFASERQLQFVAAYRDAGDTGEAFARAVRLLRADANDTVALLFVAELGPTLLSAVRRADRGRGGLRR